MFCLSNKMNIKGTKRPKQIYEGKKRRKRREKIVGKSDKFKWMRQKEMWELKKKRSERGEK